MFEAIREGRLQPRRRIRRQRERLAERRRAVAVGRPCSPSSARRSGVEDLIRGVDHPVGQRRLHHPCRGHGRHRRGVRRPDERRSAERLGLTNSHFANADRAARSGPVCVSARDLATARRPTSSRNSPNIYKIYGETGVHLEQDPAAQPQSAACHEHRRRRLEDRLSPRSPATASSARPCRTASASSSSSTAPRPTRSAAEEGAQAARLGLPRLRAGPAFRRRRGHRRGAGLRRRRRPRRAGQQGTARLAPAGRLARPDQGRGRLSGAGAGAGRGRAARSASSSSPPPKA